MNFIPWDDPFADLIEPDPLSPRPAFCPFPDEQIAGFE